MVTGNLTLVNGRPDTAIDLSDRGFQFGDGVFTTLLVQDGVPLFAREHLDRLFRDAGILRLPPPDRERLVAEMREIVSGCSSGILKIHWTRGTGGRGYLPPEELSPTRALILRPTDALSAVLPSPCKLRWAEMRLGINPVVAGAKHMNRLEQVLARLEWRGAEFDESLLLDSEGFVVEGVATNLFYLDGTTLVTPLLDRAGVRGVMRDLLMQMAKGSGYSVREERVKPESLQHADALILTNSVRGICPVGTLAGTTYENHAFAERMHASYQQELIRTRREWP